ncbi:hypothetical protein VPH35_093863 [Triticum aestivum]
MDQKRPAAVCEECGSGAYQELLVNCTYYCLVMVELEMIHEWCCDECQKKDNRDTKPIEGENSEVKPIPSQEVALLSMPTTHNWPRLVVRHKHTSRKMKCVSPNRSENQAFAFKRCAIPMPTNTDIGCESGIKSPNNNIDMPVIINSSAEYARRPPPEPICWTGCFLLSNGENFNLGEFKAYHPFVVSPRVCNIAKKMPSNMQLKISPRKNYWPKTFEKISPVYEDIALLFFPAEVDCWNKKHPRLVDTRCIFVMHAYIDDMMLLMYSSEVLPPDFQYGKSYLWGVFVKPKSKSNHARLGSIAT